MGIGPIHRPGIQRRPRALAGGIERACTGRRQVYFDDGFVDTPTYARPKLQPGDCIDGPGIIEEFGSTTVIFPGLHAQVDEYANLLLARNT
jgi:N-methylhydantoinase A